MFRFAFTVGFIFSSNTAIAQNDRQPCNIPGVGFIANNTIDECARIAQAAKGIGNWGGHTIMMSNGRLIVDGRPAGIVPNQSGSLGSLSEQCQKGDINACHQYEQQLNDAEENYDRLYGHGKLKTQ